MHELSATAQVAALQAGEFSSHELTTHYLERIAKYDDALGAFVTVTPELALVEAKRADQRIAAGDGSALLGLPLGIKDLYVTAGVRTTFGSAALADTVPDADGWATGLLRQAGAVLVGKTNTPEFGATCYTENAVTAQPSVTPYDVTRYASGSSGGGAAAVAAGLLPVAHASDGAGSIRTPATTCHLVGVKPSLGLVTAAVPPGSFFPTTTEGPLARTVADAALLLDVMAQPWIGDLNGWRPDQSFAAAIAKPPRPLKVALWTDTGLDDVSPHPECVRAVERTATLLRELGHEVREVPIPARWEESVRQAMRTHFGYLVNLVVAGLIPAERAGLLTPYTKYLNDVGAKLSGADVLQAQTIQVRYASAFAATEADVVLTPVTSGPPVPLGYFETTGIEGIIDRMLEWSVYTPWANLTGQPAVALPSHLDHDGLPYGVQLVGRPRHDLELLALAAQLESAALWGDAHPPCWSQ
ncbi:amidase [Kribbella sp. CA-293567]|uniref:amidase n=1 Tax=Kribbella sp. CA-293567 TaxID=3002436 RepID=UPI0022DD4D3B|nr:amidase [Kribbella sp. CA-293567]WBQ03381.1 amidase [Kribbella sp. CA-293567]